MARKLVTRVGCKPAMSSKAGYNNVCSADDVVVVVVVVMLLMIVLLSLNGKKKG